MQLLLSAVLAFSSSFAYPNTNGSQTISFLKKSDVSGIPDSFDARTQWPECKTIGVVPDEGTCKAHWAFAVAGAASDRICIHSNGKRNLMLSAQHIVSCASTDGCSRGHFYDAWKYWQDHGIPTGGLYDSNLGCQPYKFAPCEHHIHGSKQDCPDKPALSPKCVEKCDNRSINYEADLTFGKELYRVGLQEVEIQQEIMNNGPVTTYFEIYEDFLQYTSGIYTKTDSKAVGLLTAKIIGWGIENGTKYWLAVNSWNEDWGEKGLFRIQRGTNIGGFEKYLLAALPK